MSEKLTWIVFRAHPSRMQDDEKEDFHPDFFGTFACPVSRSNPEKLLEELLTNRKLFLIEISSTEVKKATDNWGLNESLKSAVEKQGYGIILRKMGKRPIALE